MATIDHSTVSIQSSTNPPSPSPSPSPFSSSSSSSHQLRVYDESTKQLTSALSGGHGDVTAGHANRVFSAKWHPDDENVILSGGWDNTIQIWDIRVDHAVRSIYGPHICGDSVDVQGEDILTGSWRPDNALQLWDYSSGKLIENIPWFTGMTDEPTLLYSAQFSKDGADLIAAGGSGANEAKVFDRHSLALIGTVAGMSNGVYTVDFSEDNKMLAVAGGDNAVRVLDIKNK
eukprot:TRINITY_DN1360_c0_g1_i10.p2 TRINITY_DN1360_c0_g1~~TRINITY_DN1360_c0_g1_i10.p2  ORF type:complete len:231 (+),score=81.46 TRINITY_DN1360_c0_g1_i10:1248-1940(+)